ncbi:zinc finger BED domain-containing protein 4-like [Hyperolius riggenbachi]|uniref:zinc finger BED domain-containing protein 4-like n=1 Tax=Hyperolius riggenbachi TaxID=752182 RepID=UPI0035A3B9DB
MAESQMVTVVVGEGSYSLPDVSDSAEEELGSTTSHQLFEEGESGDDYDDEAKDRDYHQPQEGHVSSSESEEEDTSVGLTWRIMISEIGRSSSEQQPAALSSSATTSRTTQPQAPTPAATKVTAAGRKGKFLSPIWNYFNLPSLDSKYVTCKGCLVKLSRSSTPATYGTSSLIKHLAGKHHKEHEEFLRLKEAGTVSVPPQTTTGTPFSTPTDTEACSGSQSSVISSAPSSASRASQKRHQTLLTEAFAIRAQPPSSRRIRLLNGLLTRAMASQLLPYSFVQEGSDMRALLQCAAPDWPFPSRHYFSRTAMPALHRFAKANVEHPPSGTPSAAKRPRLSSSSVKARHCQALLEMVSLGKQSLTAEHVLDKLKEQERRWLTPRGLRVGEVVSDNGANLVAAIRRGDLTHIPCLAHVLNLVVQKFLSTYQGMEPLLKAARKTVGYFRRSGGASSALEAVQLELNLPRHRLIIDVPTRWNSTLAMLERLVEQRQAVNHYLAKATADATTMYRSSQHPPLEDPLHGPGSSTSSHLPEMIRIAEWKKMQLVCMVLAPFLEATDLVSRDRASVCQWVTMVCMLHKALDGLIQVGERDLIQQEQQAPAQSTSVQQEEEEEVEDLELEELEVPDREDQEALPSAAAVVRGWREQGEFEEEEEDSTYEDNMPADMAALFPMAAHMLQKELYATPVQQPSGEVHAATAFGSQSQNQRLTRMVADYMGSYSGLDSDTTVDPFDYWVQHLEIWSELAQYALEVLACPPSSVLSERCFSAAGGVVTEKRSRLSTQSVDRLTFLKINQAWVVGEFLAPVVGKRGK